MLKVGGEQRTKIEVNIPSGVDFVIILIFESCPSMAIVINKKSLYNIIDFKNLI